MDKPPHREWNVLRNTLMTRSCLWGWVRRGPDPRKGHSSKSFLRPTVHLALCRVLSVLSLINSQARLGSGSCSNPHFIDEEIGLERGSCLLD